MEAMIAQIKEESNDLSVKIEQIKTNEDDDFRDYVHRKISLLQSYIDMCTLSESVSSPQKEELSNFRDKLAAIYQTLNTKSEDESYKIACKKFDKPGRPKYSISSDQLEHFMDMGFKARDMSNLLGVSEKTVRRRCKEFDIKFRDKYSSISDDELDQSVDKISKEYPGCGIKKMMGMLLVQGHILQRARVSDSMRRVDPIGLHIRSLSLNRVERRKYDVKEPQSLWHIDGYHQLIRWHLVTHGGIDGFSRYIVYLHCSDNNRAETVLTSFLSAVSNCGLPSCVRSDKGKENKDVEKYMLSHPDRGPDRRSFISGPSTHNQRIERLWKDLYIGCIRAFYELFYYLEAKNLLNCSDGVDLACLHYVFVPRINLKLKHFKDGWNKHKIPSANKMSPEQLWNGGMTLPAQNKLGQESAGNNEIDDESYNLYGVDVGEISVPDSSDNIVNVPDTPTLETILTESEFEELCKNQNPLSEDDVYGTEIYENVVKFVKEKLQQRCIRLESL